MSVNSILDGLEICEATGPEADAAARLGFLEWVFADKDGATPQAARRALAEPAAQNPSSAAARAFVGYLRQATRPFLRAGARRGRVRRVH